MDRVNCQVGWNQTKMLERVARAGAVTLAVLCSVSVVALRAQDPEILSLSPLGGQQGARFTVQVRGKNLEGAYAVWFDCSRLKASVQKIDTTPLDPEQEAAPDKDSDEKAYLVRIRMQVARSAPVGAHRLRLISPRGVSNALSFHVNSEPVLAESEIASLGDVLGKTPPFPLLITGTLSQRGEVDSYVFEAGRDQDLLFEVVTGGWPTPDLSLHQPTGSWFDSSRTSRLKSNTQSIFRPAQLTHRFAESGRYLVRLTAFQGEGGPDFSYQLRILGNDPLSDRQAATGSDSRGAHPPQPRWQERDFKRPINPERLRELLARTVKLPASAAGKAAAELGPETSAKSSRQEDLWKALDAAKLPLLAEEEPNETAAEALAIPIPVIVKGTIDRPGDVDHFKFQIEAQRQLAFEIETPRESPLRFNPRLALSSQEGAEVMTNIYKEVGGDGDNWIKTIEPKVVYTLHQAGEYHLQISDLTSRFGEDGFTYHILIRPVVPHVGDVKVESDHINLVVGQAQELSVTAYQEEGFDGGIAVTVEDLPSGVEALPAVRFEPETLPPLGAQHQERFRARSDTVKLLLLASPKARLSRTPTTVRLGFRPVVGGHPGQWFPLAEIPLMVIPVAASPD